MGEEVNAAKDTLKIDGVWDLLGAAEKIYVTSGKKILEFNPETADRAELLKKVTGRTGNLRAPALRRGEVFYIGYNDELYESILEK